jgi:hypothetical protein
MPYAGDVTWAVLASIRPQPASLSAIYAIDCREEPVRSPSPCNSPSGDSVDVHPEADQLAARHLYGKAESRRCRSVGVEVTSGTLYADVNHVMGSYTSR